MAAFDYQHPKHRHVAPQHRRSGIPPALGPVPAVQPGARSHRAEGDQDRAPCQRQPTGEGPDQFDLRLNLAEPDRFAAIDDTVAHGYRHRSRRSDIWAQYSRTSASPPPRLSGLAQARRLALRGVMEHQPECVPSPECNVLTPWRICAAVHPRVDTGRSRVVNTMPCPCGMARWSLATGREAVARRRRTRRPCSRRRAVEADHDLQRENHRAVQVPVQRVPVAGS